MGSISNYGTSINVQVGDIDSNEWILELEDIEKDTAKIIQHLSKKERFLNGTRHKFQKGDILYSKLRTYLNKVLVASNGGFCSTEIMPFGTYGVLSNEYICHVLRSNHFLDYTLRCGYGVKMPRLSTNDACKGMIPLPPLAEQQRIVTEIEKWFALIDQIEQGKDDLHSIVKQTKSKILDLAIHGELVLQDPNDEPAIELLKRINPSFTPCDNGHSGKLPQGWEWTTLGELYNIISAKRVLKSEWRNEGIPFYRAREIVKLSTTGFVDNELFISQEHYSDLKMKYGVPQSSDIMMSAVGSIGKTYIVKSSDLFYYKDASVICLQNVHGLYSVFIDYVLRTSFLQKQMYTNSKGTTVDTITIEKAREYNIPLPPLAEQQRIVTKIEELFSVLDNIQNALEA